MADVFAKAHGLDDAAVLSALQDGSETAQARQDFAIARQFAVSLKKEWQARNQ